MINGYTEIKIGLMEEGDSYSNRRGILSIQGDEFAFFDNDLKTLEKASVAEVIEFIRSRRTPAPPVEKPVVWVKWYGVTGLYERCQEDGLWGIWASHDDSGMPLESWEKYLADVVEVREWKPPPPAVCPVTGKFCVEADPAYERRID